MKFTKMELAVSIAIAAVSLPVCLALAHYNWTRPNPPVGECESIWRTSVERRGQNVDPNDWVTYRAHYNLGWALMRNGNMAGAVKRFRYCIDRAPQGSAPWVSSVVMMGVISENFGETEKAKEWYALYMSRACPVVSQVRDRVPYAWRNLRIAQEKKDSAK